MNDNILNIMPNFSLQRLIQQLIPYLILGMSIAVLIGICILLSYVLLWGLMIGVVLWLFTRIKAYFKTSTLPTKTPPKKGRTFEHQD